MARSTKKKTGPRIVGEVETAKLAELTANDWNPNRMTAEQVDALRHGFETDGWISSHALTVWRTDDKGETRNVVIDGEHRLRVALELGMTEGPVVFLDGVAESEAKALTIKLDAKRGTFDRRALSELLVDLDSIGFEVTPITLGISDDDIARALRPDDRPTMSALPGGRAERLRTVQLSFAVPEGEEFDRLIAAGQKKTGDEDVSSVVLAALRVAFASKKKKAAAREAEATS